MKTDLKARLDTLRHQSGAVADPRAATVPDGDLAARLDRLGAGRRYGGRTEAEAMAPDRLAAHLQGELIDSGVIRVERRIALDDRHGTATLAALAGEAICLPQGPFDPADLVFLDTETSGLAGGTGTVAFLVGMARVDGSVLRVRQYFMTRFAAEPAMLAACAEELAGAAALVSYNGKSFDVPLLRDRWRLAGSKAPVDGPDHLDLLHPARRLFGQRWPDCRLATAEQELLGFRRHDDLPGSEAPLAWFDFIHRGDAARLPAVARHNLWDLVSLAALLPVVAGAYTEPARWRADPEGAAQAWCRAGDEARALAVLEKCGELEEGAALALARLYRRAGRWSEAAAVWEGLAAEGCVEAVERLAKYYEHVRRDCDTALRYACRLNGEVAAWRRNRLRGKIAARDIPGDGS